MIELHHLPQDYTSNGRGAETKLSKSRQIDAINVNNIQDMVHVPSPREKLGTCGLEGIKRSPAEPLK